MGNFTLFLVKRIFQSLLLLVAISLLIFCVVQLLPGDAVDIMLAGVSELSLKQETVEALRRQLGLHLPLHIQYLRWIGGVVRGDFGTSLIMKAPIGPIIFGRLKTSLLLAFPASLIMIGTGLLVGVLAAVKENTGTDKSIFVFCLIARATPAFVVGSLFLYIFAVKLHIIPAAYNAVDWKSLSLGQTLTLFPRVLIFPSLTIAFGSVAHVLLQTRASLIEELKANYVRMAIVKGAPKRRIIFIHALRNALLPTITVIAINIGYIISGVVVVEVVFSYPGIGYLMLSAIMQRDVPLMLSTMLVISGSYVFANLVADILYAVFNPRVRYA